MQVDWKAFPLHPDTPREGLSLEALFADRPVDVQEMVRHLRQKAFEMGLPFGERTMTYNSRLAHETAKWAARRGCEETFQRAIFQAYFADGLNIGEPAVLVRVAADAGLPEAEAGRIIRDRTFRQDVDRDWARSRKEGITAVPTLLVNGRSLVGAQPTAVIEAFLDQNGVGRVKKKTVDR